MKKNDTYVGNETGLCLKIQDVKAKVVKFTVERRIVDRSTGEIKIVVNEREAPSNTMPTVLRGYHKEG